MASIASLFRALRPFSLSEQGLLLTGLAPKVLLQRWVDPVFDKMLILRWVEGLGGSFEQVGPDVVVRLPFGASELKVVLRRTGSDLLVFKQVLLLKEYEPIVYLAASLHRPIRTILDAGANVGCTSLFFHRMFPEAQIVAIEPDPHNCEQLRRNKALNQIEALTPLEAALWDSPTRLALDHSFRDGQDWAVTVKSPEVGQSTASVEGVTLRQVMEQQGWEQLDILKIDVEGAEQKLFAAREEMLAILQRVQFLTVEIHDELADRKMIMDLVTEAGMISFYSGETLFAYRPNA